jgi:hypothetical protein
MYNSTLDGTHIITVVPGKLPPRVFDYFMLQPKTDLRYGLDEVGFHTPHLIGVGQNPSPTSQPEEILLSVYSEGAHMPRLLLEPNLPGHCSCYDRDTLLEVHFRPALASLRQRIRTSGFRDGAMCRNG